MGRRWGQAGAPMRQTTLCLSPAHDYQVDQRRYNSLAHYRVFCHLLRISTGDLIGRCINFRIVWLGYYESCRQQMSGNLLKTI